MKKNILALSLFFLTGTTFAQSPNWLWAKQIGGNGYDAGYYITVDAIGNIYTAGTFDDTVDFDPGPNIFNLFSSGGGDIFIYKSNAAGNFLWAKSMGGPDAEYPNNIAIDGSGNIYTTGPFENTADFDPSSGTYNLTSAGSKDIFISKLDSSGNFIWAKSMGGTGVDESYFLNFDALGNVYTTGWFNDTADFNPDGSIYDLTSNGMTDIFISKLNNNGNFIWAKSIGSTAGDYSNSIAIDDSGNIFTTGLFQNTVDFDPGMGLYNLTSAGDNDLFISKLNSSGDFIWCKSIGASGADAGYSLTIDDSTNIVVIGDFQETIDFDPGSGISNLTSAGNYDIFIAKFSNSGNFIWAKSIGGSASDSPYGIATNATGNIFITGNYEGTADFDPSTALFEMTSFGSKDFFITKLDASGNFIWATATGGSDYDFVWSITVDASDHVLITGEYYSPFIDFDSYNLGNTNKTGSTDDIFIGKLDNIFNGIENVLENKDLTIYPNLTNNNVNVKAATKLFGVVYTIYDTNGKAVLTGQIKSENTLIELDKLPCGIYLFSVGENLKHTFKVIKE